MVVHGVLLRAPLGCRHKAKTGVRLVSSDAGRKEACT